MQDTDATHITGRYTDTSPVFIGYIMNHVVRDLQVGTQLIQICRCVRDMCLEALRTEAAGADTTAADILKHTVINLAALGLLMIV
jgi:hypothetical protein